MIRRPAVANQFYPGNRTLLEDTVNSMVNDNLPKEDVLAIIAPHAGYIYSGKVAGSIYSVVRIPDNIILIGPNHTGLGEPAAVMSSGAWEIPTGVMDINVELAKILLEESEILIEDSYAHLQEHSLEVQLPFIHHFNPEARIVPITVMHLTYSRCLELGRSIAEAAERYEGEVLIVVSSDMNHYESHEVTKRKDEKAIDKIIALDAEGLLNVTEEENITMCGVIPAAVAIVASKEMGGIGAKLVEHVTSGETSGDYMRVVGYAGILIK